MSLLGPNLAQLLRLSGGTFSLRTTMMIGLQIVDRLRSVHGCNYLYCDIKPENFMVGLGGDSRTVFMADFGKCRRYRSKTTGQHIPYREMSYEQVNPTFVSLNVHNNIQCSRRDDIESLLYMLSYLRNGKLPWKTDEVFCALLRPREVGTARSRRSKEW